jgi:hypothetical protein
MKLNKVQVAIIWISLSILIPASYNALKEISVNNASMKVWKAIEKGEMKEENTTAEQREINLGYMKNKEDRDRTAHVFSVFAFELLSLTGLLVYLTNRKK